MSNRDLYLDEFGQYHEVDESLENDEELDIFEDDDNNFLFDEEAFDDEVETIDEDEEYAHDYNSSYKSEVEIESEFDEES